MYSVCSMQSYRTLDIDSALEYRSNGLLVGISNDAVVPDRCYHWRTN